MLKQRGSASSGTKPTERKNVEEDYNSRLNKMQKEEYLIKNACYSVTKYYLCKQNNKRSLLGRKQQSQVARSFPNRYLFSYTDKVTSLFSISCILDIILQCKRASFTWQKSISYFSVMNLSYKGRMLSGVHFNPTSYPSYIIMVYRALFVRP